MSLTEKKRCIMSYINTRLVSMGDIDHQFLVKLGLKLCLMFGLLPFDSFSAEIHESPDINVSQSASILSQKTLPSELLPPDFFPPELLTFAQRQTTHTETHGKIKSKIRGFLDHLGDSSFNFAIIPAEINPPRDLIVTIVKNRDNSLNCIDALTDGWSSKWPQNKQHILGTLCGIALTHGLFLEITDLYTVSSLMLVYQNDFPRIHFGGQQLYNKKIHVLERINQELPINKINLWS